MRKILPILLLLFVLAMSLAACDNGEIVDEPFTTLADTTEEKPEISDPATEDSKEQCMCGGMARVTRNAQGQVMEEICLGHSNYYTYDTDGRLAKCRFQRDTIGSQEYDVVYETDKVATVAMGETEYLKITYGDDESIVQKEIFANDMLIVLKYNSDHQMNEMTLSTGNESFDFEFQFKDNFLVQVDSYAIEDSDKEKAAEILYTYDENGRLFQIDQRVYEGSESALARSTRYFYEAEGGLIQKTYEFQDSASSTDPFLSECVKYNSDWRVLETGRYYNNGSYYVSQYEYSGDTAISGIQNKYDQNSVLYGKAEFIFENGNRVKEVYYDDIEVGGVDGYLRVQTYELGYSIYPFGYLNSSMLVSTVLYDPNGEIYSENDGEITVSPDGVIVVPQPSDKENDEDSSTEDEKPPLSLYFSGFDMCFSCGRIMHEEHLSSDEFPDSGSRGIGQEQCLCFCYDYYYDQNGRLSQIKVTDKKTLETHAYDVVFESDTCAKAKMEGYYDYWQFQFDENGDLVQIDIRKDWTLFEIKYNSLHQVSNLRQFEYGTLKELNYEFQYENGTLIGILGYSNNAQAERVLTEKISYVYNEFGELVECIYDKMDEEGVWCIVEKRCFLFNYEEEYWLCESYELASTGELRLISRAFYTWEYGEPLQITEYAYIDESYYHITDKRYEYRKEDGIRYSTVYMDTYNSDGYHYMSSVCEYIDGEIVFEEKRYYTTNEVVTEKIVTEYESGLAIRETVYNYQYEIDGVDTFTRICVYELDSGIIRYLISEVIYDSNGNVYIPSEEDGNNEGAGNDSPAPNDELLDAC